ncbi:unnamed protein product [Amoebophrya sp. A120]|nr:unnamed protein product [Amoebophrya sp. A120]|eukprot:GSA120T00003425001.1
MAVSGTRMQYAEFLKRVAEDLAVEVGADFDSGKLTLPEDGEAFGAMYQQIMGMLAQKVHENTEKAADKALQTLPADVVKVGVSGFLKPEAGGGDPAGKTKDVELPADLPAAVLTMPNKCVAAAWCRKVTTAMDAWAASYKPEIISAASDACRECRYKRVRVEMEALGETGVDDGGHPLVVLRDCPQVPDFVRYGAPDHNDMTLMITSIVEKLAEDLLRLGYCVEYKDWGGRTISQSAFIEGDGHSFHVTWSFS